MQHPRRTTEFNEEPTTNKRQPRQQQRQAVPSPAPNTAQKYATRQSRIAVLSRPSSSDRVQNSLGAALIGQPSTAPTRGSSSMIGRTPQKTPLGKSPSSRLLLTAEKHRPLGIAQHNDKRWQHEQAQRITEFLEIQWAAAGSIPGITQEFFTVRSGGLRHMSITQFVAIINYLLHFASGNRMTVSTTNHIEDTVNVLEKLRYPHQLKKNKSWLKTPNTQNSAGNVLLLLDFLMDFVPQQQHDEETTQFPFQQQPNDFVDSQLDADDEYMRINDVEFQANLLRYAEQGFILWDKHQQEDLKSLQEQTCDEIIAKHCDNLNSLVALQSDIVSLQQRLKNLEKQLPPVHKQEEEQNYQIEKELKYKMQEIEMLRDDLETQAQQTLRTQARLPIVNTEVKCMRTEIQTLQSTISSQLCSVEQRDELIEHKSQHMHMLQSMERVLRDIQNCSHHQQVVQSRTKKQLMDQIEQFNGHIREISYAELYSSTAPTDELQLPLVVQQQDLERMAPMIKALRKHIEKQLQVNTANFQKIEQQNLQQLHVNESSLNPKLSSLCNALAAAKKLLQQCEQLIAKEREVLLQNLEQARTHEQQLKIQQQEIESALEQKQTELLGLAAENEQTMLNAEQECNANAAIRLAYLEEQEAAIERANVELQKLTDLMNMQRA